MKKIILLVIWGFSLLITSCATTIDAVYSAKASEFSVQSIYLVKKSENSKEMDERIKASLEKRNLKVVLGSDIQTTKNEDAILKYTENWQTEVTTNLISLDLILFSPEGELMASSHWKNSKFNSLLILSNVVDESIGVIFEKVKIKP